MQHIFVSSFFFRRKSKTPRLSQVRAHFENWHNQFLFTNFIIWLLIFEKVNRQVFRCEKNQKQKFKWGFEFLQSQQYTPYCHWGKKHFWNISGLKNKGSCVCVCARNMSCEHVIQIKQQLLSIFPEKHSVCFGCGAHIHDQYILKVAPDLEWHATCLKCSECGQYLDENCTCFVRNGKAYCKSDYFR